MTSADPTPPGWYDDGQGWLRWFDGTRWTAHVHGQLPSGGAAMPGLGVSAAAVNASFAEEAPHAPDAPDPLPDAGWYEDGEGEVRWYDGEEWTDHVHDPSVLADAKLAELPLYRRPWFVASLVLVVLLAVVAAVASGDPDAPSAEATGTVSPVAATAAAGPSASGSPSTSSSPSASASAASPAPTRAADVVVDGDWSLSALDVRKDKYTDTFAASGRVTYRGKSDDAWGNFRVTLLKDGEQVASMLGAVATIEPGKPKTVEFVSTDRYVAGPYTVQFRREA